MANKQKLLFFFLFKNTIQKKTPQEKQKKDIIGTQTMRKDNNDISYTECTIWR